MKVIIYETSLDPMYKISLFKRLHFLPMDDVSEEFFEKYQRVMKEFEEVQAIIKQLGQTQGYW